MKVCSVEGCGGKAHARGWCRNHYQRWRAHGDPLGGSTSRGECAAFVLKSMDTATDSCIEWQYSKAKGYGVISIDNVQTYAHVVVLTIKHGPKPTSEHQAAHSCGNRACINHRHLRWATPSENQMDRIEHGTSNRGERQWRARLTRRDVDSILARLRSGESQGRVADAFGVSRGAITGIVHGSNWSWHTGIEKGV